MGYRVIKGGEVGSEKERRKEKKRNGELAKLLHSLALHALLNFSF